MEFQRDPSDSRRKIGKAPLAARRRLAEVPATAVADRATAAGPVTLPGRVAVRADSAETTPAARGHVSGTSVFDNLPPIEHIPSTTEVAAETEATVADESQRTGALRRLIGSLRRR